MRAEYDYGQAARGGAEVLSMDFNFAFGQSCRGYDFVDARCHFFPVGLDARARHVGLGRSQ
jgi:hypothetical protein